MSDASLILNNMWAKGTTYECNYCNSLSSSISSGIAISLEDDTVDISSPNNRNNLCLSVLDDISCFNTRHYDVAIGTGNYPKAIINSQNLNDVEIPWNTNSIAHEVFSESNVEDYVSMIGTVLSAFMVFVEGYPDEDEENYEVWFSVIREILGE